MDREEILLKEYEVCQSDIHSHAHHYWIIFGIFMTVNTALLAGIAYSLISQSVPYDEFFKYTILGLGLGIILIITCLWQWLQRINFLIKINHKRMHEIEIILDMWKSLMVHLIDKWNKRKRKLGYKKTKNLNTKDKTTIVFKIKKKLGFKEPKTLTIEDESKIWEKIEIELVREFSKDDFKILVSKKERIIELCEHQFTQKEYKRPSRYVSYIGILIVLSLLWVGAIVTAFLVKNPPPS